MILGLGVVLGGAAVVGLSFGLWVARLDETRVINKIAAEYMDGGGRAEDCVARPGTDPVWIVVTCGDTFVRAVNRFGFQVRVDAAVPEA